MEKIRVVLRQVASLQWGVPGNCTGEKDAMLPELFELVAFSPSPVIVNILFHPRRLQLDVGLC